MKTDSFSTDYKRKAIFGRGWLRKSAALLGAAMGTLALESARAQFTFPVYEPFAYPQGERIRTAGSSGTNWNFGNSLSSTSSPLDTSNAALAYPGLLPDPNNPPRGVIGPTVAGRTLGATMTPQTNGTIYSSFLFNLETLPSGDRPIFGLNGNNSGTPSPNSGAAVWVSSTGQLKISKNNSTAPATNVTSPLVLSNTYFIVLAYKFLSTPDEVDLWVNPTSLGNNSSVPPPTISITNGSDNTSIQSVCIYSGSSTPVLTNLMDEIRVDNNWAGVTPAGCSPGNVYNVTGGGSVCPGGGFPSVGLDGSQTGVDYWLMQDGAFSGTVVSGTGSGISLGSVSNTATYSVLASNTTTSCAGWMNGSVVANIGVLPSITTQPAPAAVPNGSLAVFSVSATGSSLQYQWRKNGVNLTDGGNISGSKTPNLVISPVGAGDLAAAGSGYDVVVSNTCIPPVTSTRVALSSRSPASITWRGDGTAELWDIATTANFVDGGNNPVQFFNGDAVTIDDGGNTPINLVNGFLSPSSITFNSGFSYSFTNGGHIVGPTTTITMINQGTLTMNSGNTYGGGTVISNNGSMIFYAGDAFGTGPIALAGGTLEALNIQGLTLGNALTVSGDNTIKIDNTSTSALILTNNVTGSSGSLRFLNGTDGRGPTFQLNGPATSLSMPITLDLGNNGTNLFMSFNNGAGTQIISGAVSGGGTIQRNASGGSTVLSGQSTCSGGTLLSNGAIGVGADSVSSVPPTIDSSPLGAGPLTIGTGGGTPRLYASGDHTVGNPIVYQNGTVGSPLVVTGSFNLTLSGAFDLGGTNRTIQSDGSGVTAFTGVISDGGLIKTGTNNLILGAVNTYTGPTIVSNGTLQVNGQIDVGGVTVVSNGVIGGTGTILGVVTINANGALSPGGGGIGTLTINNNLTIGGNVNVDVNKSLLQSNDVTVVSGALSNTGSGTVSVTDLGPLQLTAGDSFKIFNKAVANGGGLSVTGGNVVWTNKLAVDGSIAVLSVVVPHPRITSVSTSGSNLILSGTNGGVNSQFYVLSSTNVALPLASWTKVATNNYDGSGHFSVTNAVSPSDAQRFFILQSQ